MIYVDCISQSISEGDTAVDAVGRNLANQLMFSNIPTV